jgi:hypothetical protein
MCICIENTIEKRCFSIHDYCLLNNKNTHTSAGYLDFNIFCDLLYKNFNTILDNLEKGG